MNNDGTTKQVIFFFVKKKYFKEEIVQTSHINNFCNYHLKLKLIKFSLDMFANQSLKIEAMRKS